MRLCARTGHDLYSVRAPRALDLDRPQRVFPGAHFTTRPRRPVEACPRWPRRRGQSTRTRPWHWSMAPPSATPGWRRHSRAPLTAWAGAAPACGAATPTATPIGPPKTPKTFGHGAPGPHRSWFLLASPRPRPRTRWWSAPCACRARCGCRERVRAKAQRRADVVGRVPYVNKPHVPVSARGQQGVQLQACRGDALG